MAASDDLGGQLNGPGGFKASPASIERDAKAVELRAKGRTYAVIAKELDYYDESAVRQAIQRRLKEVTQPAVTELRAEMDAQLEHVYREVMRVLEATHLKVANGDIVFDPSGGGPMEDDAPVLAATDRLLRIMERRAKLYGLDAPTKVQAEVQNVKVTVEGADDV